MTEAAGEGGVEVDEAVLRARLRELMDETPDLGYRAAHAALQGEERFRGVGVKRVQKSLRGIRDGAADPAAEWRPPPPPGSAVGGCPPASGGFRELTLERPDTAAKFGMMIATDPSAPFGGHAVTEVREGGVVAAWNRQRPAEAVQIGDVIVAVNGRDTFDGMMGEFRDSLACALRIVRQPVLTEDASEGAREQAAWEARKARVTAALIPGLKQIVEKEFGEGAGDRIGRVEEMYRRVGRSDVYEEDTPLGKRYSPGYIAGLSPVRPFHSTKDRSWCAELRTSWKAIRKELHGSLDESLWTGGAYQASNEAYGKDWKIMGVLTEDKWQDEQRFKVTTSAIKKLQGMVPFEAFFARMPPRTKIAPHSDNLSYILTSHLALDLEEGACSITVGTEEKYWKEGEMLILDTTFIHSTKNESARPRYILVLRFWHPGLTPEERRAIHVSHMILAGAAKK